MLTLTVRNPWADLIASGRKRIENRSWSTSHRGIVLIHAGVSRIDCGDNYQSESFGKIVAAVTLSKIITIDELRANHESLGISRGEVAEFAEGPICWIFDKVIKINSTNRVNGKQGLWMLDDSLAREVKRQLPGDFR